MIKRAAIHGTEAENAAADQAVAHAAALKKETVIHAAWVRALKAQAERPEALKAKAQVAKAEALNAQLAAEKALKQVAVEKGKFEPRCKMIQQNAQTGHVAIFFWRQISLASQCYFLDQREALAKIRESSRKND